MTSHLLTALNLLRRIFGLKPLPCAITRRKMREEAAKKLPLLLILALALCGCEKKPSKPAPKFQTEFRAGQQVRLRNPGTGFGVVYSLTYHGGANLIWFSTNGTATVVDNVPFSLLINDDYEFLDRTK